MKKIMCYLLCMFCLFVLCACDEEVSYDGQVKVTFCLEGGTYMNCTRPVVLYFDYSEGDSNYICSPDVLTRKEIIKSGYYLSGWYKTRVDDGENISYSDEFNFATDTVGKDELTLYAYWEKNIVYTYNVCYKDALGEKVVLGTYKVNAGDKFDDYNEYSNKNWGYTPLRYVDEDGNPWDENFTHPGGSESLAVDVYVEYLDGEYLIVTNAEQLSSRISSSQNIYLAADIDLEGRELCFVNYRGTLKGNGYTISNFKLGYGTTVNDLIDDLEGDGTGNTLCLSLFGKTKNAVIENVNFNNVTFELNTTFQKTKKIYVVPLATIIENTKLKDINFTGTFNIKNLPSSFNIEEDLVFVGNSAYYKKDEISIIENVNVVLTEIN